MEKFNEKMFDGCSVIDLNTLYKDIMDRYKEYKSCYPDATLEEKLPYILQDVVNPDNDFITIIIGVTTFDKEEESYE